MNIVHFLTLLLFFFLLLQLGVTDLFSSGAANLTGISSEKPLFVSSVTQKAFINVTETGVEAAAATAGKYY